MNLVCISLTFQGGATMAALKITKEKLVEIIGEDVGE